MSSIKISYVRSDSQAQEFEVAADSCVFDLVKELKLRDPHQAVAVKVNGELADMGASLTEGDEVNILDFSDPEGQYVYWHSSAHVLAQAVLRLWPEAKPTIGPPIENGFYYDFANLQISDEDFTKIEKEMQKIAKENVQPKRHVFADKNEALSEFADNPYKTELINSFDDGEISAYRQGDFFDLCRGPHLSNLGKIKAVKVTKTSGAYWKGDSEREMLTRVYAITFPERQQLKDYLHRVAEAKKRDHKVLGPKLGLFSLKEEAPGMPFIHPRGVVVWNALLDWWRELHRKADYVEIKTPHMMTKDLWVTSGHWENYREHMYTTAIEEREYAIKPMNCPGGMLYYKSDLHSYREFPLRVAELGLVHRYEHSGAMSGLLRVRSFHQDDAHIFMTKSQIEDEILGALKLADEIYTKLGLSYKLELSTRPEKSIGSDEDWELSTESLRRALERSGAEFRVNEGDGAFYGPKIDMHVRDAIGRTWQCGTIQLDMSLPERFDLEYTTPEGDRQRPIMIHRALFGSIERFFGILIEHFAGRFPLWLSPQHVQVMPVADRHHDFAYEVAKSINKAGLIAKVDDSSESVGKKVRNAQLQQINYMITIGDKEVENGKISLRTRNNVVHSDVDLNEFIAKVLEEKDKREPETSFVKAEPAESN